MKTSNNPFTSHGKLLAKFIRDRNYRLYPGNEDQSTISDNNILASELECEPSEEITVASWGSELSDPQLEQECQGDSILQAALDEIQLEDEIDELEFTYDKNETKIEQLEEVKRAVVMNWDTVSTQANELVKINVASESVLREFKDKKLTLSKTIEAVNEKQKLLATAGIAALAAIIFKIIQFIKAKFGQGGNSIETNSQSNKLIEEASKLIDKLGYQLGSNLYIHEPKLLSTIRDLGRPFAKSIETTVRDAEKKQDDIKIDNENYVSIMDLHKVFTNSVYELLGARGVGWMCFERHDTDIGAWGAVSNKLVNNIKPILDSVILVVKETENAILDGNYNKNVVSANKTNLDKLVSDIKALQNTKSFFERNKTTTSGNLAPITTLADSISAVAIDYPKGIKSVVSTLEKTMAKIEKHKPSPDNEVFVKTNLTLVRDTLKYVVDLQQFTNTLGFAKFVIAKHFYTFAHVVSFSGPKDALTKS